MELNKKIFLHYLAIEDLFFWIEENKIGMNSFSFEQEKWINKNKKGANFFSDTNLILMKDDFLLLKVLNEEHLFFLSKNYKLDFQIFCEDLFSEKKNLILISEKQWKEKQKEVNLIVLWKDKEGIENGLKNWFEKLNSTKY